MLVEMHAIIKNICEVANMEENKRDQKWFGLAMILCGALVSIPS
jgi:cytosine permease